MPSVSAYAAIEPRHDRDYFSISDLSAEFEVTARALRFYEDEGLIAPERRGTQRVYSHRDRARLAWILRGKRVGFSLAEIREMIDLYDIGDGRQVQPYFLLNQFDASLPLHLDVREVLRRQLGDRLLPFVVRRAPAVPEALAEGMTVMDYAPDAAVSADYTNVASWLRSIAAPATAGFRNLRLSER